MVDCVRGFADDGGSEVDMVMYFVVVVVVYHVTSYSMMMLCW